MEDKVLVLMSVYNGEKYISEQIESLINQNNISVDLLIRDDGSNDLTYDIIKKYKDKISIKYYSGENKKSALSFLDLIDMASGYKYYAFCDQDDVWKNDKLFRAIKCIKELENSERYILYCSNYQLVDAKMNLLSDNGHVTTTKVNESLVSSCCTGCTVVFNDNLLQKIKNNIPNVIVMHDDWVHKVCLALGGKVYYDNYKSLFYRQHGNNVDGGVHTFKSKIRNFIKRFKSKDCIRSNQLKEIYRIYNNDMTKEIKKMYEDIIDYRNKNFFKRIKLAFFSNYRTKYKRLNIGFKLAILLKYY